MTMSAAWASPGVEITPQGLMPARKHDTSDDRLVRKILQANRSVSSLSLEQQQSLSRKASEKGFGFGGVVYQHPSALHDGLLCYHVTSPLRRFGKAKAMSWRAGLRTGVLRVTVTQAYGLAAADLRGTSDPYVVAEFGGQKKKTSIIMRTLAPAWGETLQVYGLLDDFLDSGVKLQVFDWDEVGMDDVLGECAIKLQEELRLTNQEFTKEYVERLSPEGHIIFKSRAALAVKERVRSAGPVRIPVLLPHKFDYVQLSYERIAQAEQAQKTKEEYAARLAGKLPWPKPRPTKLKLGKAKSSPALVRPPSSKIFANEAFQTGQQVR